MRLDLDKVRENARGASTEDLLDRVTVYRAEMEPEALEVLEDELRGRGVSAAEQADHGERRRQAAVVREGGEVVRCERCRRPAVWEGTAWHRLWGVVPLFPRRMALCEEHRPRP
jgi:hypothetical protein